MARTSHSPSAPARSRSWRIPSSPVPALTRNTRNQNHTSPRTPLRRRESLPPLPRRKDGRYVQTFYAPYQNGLLGEEALTRDFSSPTAPPAAFKSGGKASNS